MEGSFFVVIASPDVNIRGGPVHLGAILVHMEPTWPLGEHAARWRRVSRKAGAGERERLVGEADQWR